VLRACASVLKVLNPLLFFASLFAASAIVVRFVMRWRDRSRDAAVVVAGLFFYVTVVYSILQSEPRYSIAFRPAEILLFVTMLVWLWRAVAAFRSRNIVAQ
jgi:hypothetical protein